MCAPPSYITVSPTNLYIIIIIIIIIGEVEKNLN